MPEKDRMDSRNLFSVDRYCWNTFWTAADSSNGVINLPVQSYRLLENILMITNSFDCMIGHLLIS